MFLTNHYFGNTAYENMIDALYRIKNKRQPETVDFKNMRNTGIVNKVMLPHNINAAVRPYEKVYERSGNFIIEYINSCADDKTIR